MPVIVRVPTLLQKFTQNQAEVKANGADINLLIDDLEKNFPGMKERICDETGKVRRFINIYVNGEDIRFLQQDKTSLEDGDEVSIIPAIAGGASVGDCPKIYGAYRELDVVNEARRIGTVPGVL